MFLEETKKRMDWLRVELRSFSILGGCALNENFYIVSIYVAVFEIYRMHLQIMYL